jgi:hypothetical protein
MMGLKEFDNMFLLLVLEKKGALVAVSFVDPSLAESGTLRAPFL